MINKLKMTARILALLVLLSCSKKGGENGNDTPEKGFATGKVTNTDGTPFAGVKIVVDNTMIYNSYVATTSDAKGLYKVKLPSVGTFLATAYIEKTYNGKKYKLDFHPDNIDEFSIDGAVRNFSYKLTGERPDGLGYYGGTINIDKDIMSEIYDSENIEFTLVPVGTLIDGSTGATLKLKHGAPSTETYGKLVDVPIGRYNVTAEYISGGIRKALQLKNRVSDGPYTNKLQIDFEPEIIWGFNIAAIGYK
ncbi:MAG: carboxypeptidase regulatory-like domain-containing protein, partial [Proteobacteria bacterium]